MPGPEGIGVAVYSGSRRNVLSDSEVLHCDRRSSLHKATVTANRRINISISERQVSVKSAALPDRQKLGDLTTVVMFKWQVDAGEAPQAQSGIVRRLPMQKIHIVQAPMYHSSTPITSNFLPSSLNGSFPNVRQGLEMPLSRLSSSHSP